MRHPRRPSHLREEPTDREAGGDGHTEHQHDAKHRVDDDYAAAPSSASPSEPGSPALLIGCPDPPPPSPLEPAAVGCSKHHRVGQRALPRHSSGKRCSTSSATAYAVRGCWISSLEPARSALRPYPVAPRRRRSWNVTEPVLTSSPRIWPQPSSPPRATLPVPMPSTG